MSTVVITRGPIFNGEADTSLRRACRDVQRKVAQETEHLVKTYGQVRFRYEHKPPTGKWLEAVHTESKADYAVVTDGGIIYGPWLEGIGSRNQTTRFKGYRMWRKAYQDMNRSGARTIAQPIIDRAVARLNK
jgi:hypothetical protein